jgi:Nuclease-related domain
MYPADGPVQDTWSDGECRLYEVLRRDLSDDYHVIQGCSWQAMTKPGRIDTGVADYIVIHPRHGILVVEVRGGTISVDSRATSWSSRTVRGNTRGEKKRIKDPFKQGLNSMAVLVRYLRQDERTKPHAEQYRPGYAAWFPDIEWQRTKVREAMPDVTLDMRDLASPEAGLQRVYDGIPLAFLKEDLSAEAIQAVIDLLTSHV